MSTEYDSAQIRALAARIQRAADTVNNVKTGPLRSAKSEMQGNFEGRAATALQDSLDELTADVNAVGVKLAGVAKALNALAAKVEEADRQAQQVINSK